MGKYNVRKSYNKDQNNEGMSYNYNVFKIIVNVFDQVVVSDVSKYISCMIMKREDILVSELFHILANKLLFDEVQFDDTQLHVKAFIEKMEELNVHDKLFEILVNVSLNDSSMKLVEELNHLVILSRSEDIELDDSNYLHALCELAERFSLEEARLLMLYLELFEDVGITDGDVDTAESDFYIGKADHLDVRFDKWLMPFELLMDVRKSSIDIMPPTETTQIDIPYSDGSIEQDTVYKNRFFEIVAWSLDGLTVHEKEEMKQMITELLDGTKNEKKTLTFAKNSISFDVKYDGQLKIEEAPSAIKATIPFSASPYASDLFETKLEGDSLIINEGHANLGVKVAIRGYCVNPNFFIGSTEFLWQGYVPEGKDLIIDNENKTCYLIDELGNKEQALERLIKGNRFVTLPKGTSMVLRTLNSQTQSAITVTYKTKYLWKSSNVGEE